MDEQVELTEAERCPGNVPVRHKPGALPDHCPVCGLLADRLAAVRAEVANLTLAGRLAMARAESAEAERDDLREVLRIGTELDNHHNADACPYCAGGIRAERDDLRAAVEGGSNG